MRDWIKHINTHIMYGKVEIHHVQGKPEATIFDDPIEFRRIIEHFENLGISASIRLTTFENPHDPAYTKHWTEYNGDLWYKDVDVREEFIQHHMTSLVLEGF